MSDTKVAASVTQMDYKTLQWLVLDLRDMLCLDDGESLKHAVQSLLADRAALAAQGEPVGYINEMGELVKFPTPSNWMGEDCPRKKANASTPDCYARIYTAPPAPAKPMTREQAMAIVQSNPDTMTAIRMTEAHHGITDKGGA